MFGRRQAAGAILLLRTRLTALLGAVRTHPEQAALVGLLSLGAAARAALTFVYSGAFTGYSDSGIYFQDAVQSVWTDPVRTVGYSMFLRVLHALSPHILLVVIVQHGLGLGAALLLYLAVRRAGGPTWLGLIPAAALALLGDELFIEHAALSETPFIFLLACLLYSAIRAGQGRAWWAALAGLCLGLAVWDRESALGLVVVVVVWFLFSRGRPGRRTALLAAVALVSAGATIEVYIEWRQLASGHSGLTTNDAWNLYGRVAPWADCNDFTPPPGTQVLCESTAPAQRGYRPSEYYIYGGLSPAIAAFGPVYLYPKNPRAPALLESFAQAAILGQPLAYLHAVARDAVRLIDPDFPSYGDQSATGFYNFLLYGGPTNSAGTNAFVLSWQTLLYPHDSVPTSPNVRGLLAWERLTRIQWFLMVLLLVACLAGPWLVPPGRARSNLWLFASVSLAILLFPLFTKSYDYRFVIPVIGPGFAAAALAYWGAYARLRERAGVIDPSPISH
jgi:hypothetical protein